MAVKHCPAKSVVGMALTPTEVGRCFVGGGFEELVAIERATSCQPPHGTYVMASYFSNKGA